MRYPHLDFSSLPDYYIVYVYNTSAILNVQKTSVSVCMLASSLALLPRFVVLNICRWLKGTTERPQSSFMLVKTSWVISWGFCVFKGTHARTGSFLLLLSFIYFFFLCAFDIHLFASYTTPLEKVFFFCFFFSRAISIISLVGALRVEVLWGQGMFCVIAFFISTAIVWHSTPLAFANDSAWRRNIGVDRNAKKLIKGWGM